MVEIIPRTADYATKRLLERARFSLLAERFGQPTPTKGNWLTRFILCRVRKDHIWVKTRTKVTVFYEKFCDRCGDVITKKPSGKTAKFRRYEAFNNA